MSIGDACAAAAVASSGGDAWPADRSRERDSFEASMSNGDAWLSVATASLDSDARLFVNSGELKFFEENSEASMSN
eukprot:4613336-Karenia_brevis.AAC.1